MVWLSPFPHPPPLRPKFIAKRGKKNLTKNSLDVVPNSLGQVSSAIEGRRIRSSPTASTGRRSGSIQGRAFSAPRKHSVTRLRGERMSRDDVDDLTQALDESPRKVRKASLLGNREADGKESIRLEAEDDALPDLRRTLSLELGPRIQASTSGLAFEDDEGHGNDNHYDLWNTRAGTRSSSDNSQSRKMVLGRQQSEISFARKTNRAFGQEGWRNVAVEDSWVFFDVDADGMAGRRSRGGGGGGGVVVGRRSN
jgi:hypothetical protein